MSPSELLQIKELLVDDAVKTLALQAEMHQQKIMDLVEPTIEKVNSFDGRMSKIERERGIVIKGALVYATVVASIVGWGLNFIKSKLFHWG